FTRLLKSSTLGAAYAAIDPAGASERVVPADAAPAHFPPRLDDRSQHVIRSIDDRSRQSRERSSGMEQPSLGDQELEVLRFVAEHAPISVGEVAERFGEPRGLARTTILTVMERLRKKGFLTRSKAERP